MIYPYFFGYCHCYSSLDKNRFLQYNPCNGEVSEWSNVPLSKSGVSQGTAGSNPALSAKEFHSYRVEFLCYTKMHYFVILS